MFRWFRRRAQARARQRLVEQRLRLLAMARDLQRSGDIKAYAAKMAEADQIARELVALDRTATT